MRFDLHWGWVCDGEKGKIISRNTVSMIAMGVIQIVPSLRVEILQFSLSHFAANSPISLMNFLPLGCRSLKPFVLTFSTYKTNLQPSIDSFAVKITANAITFPLFMTNPRSNSRY
jgi:hypothetical protein